MPPSSLCLFYGYWCCRDGPCDVEVSICFFRVAVMFVASESPLGQETVPVLWCLDTARDQPRWAEFVGAAGDEISSSSPLITTTSTGNPIIMFASQSSV